MVVDHEPVALCFSVVVMAMQTVADICFRGEVSISEE